MADIRVRVELRSGVLRVGASTTVAGYWLPQHVATFVQRFPGVGFELQVGNPAGIGHAIAEGRIDVAFVEGVVDDPGIVATPWRDEPLQVAVAAEDRKDVLVGESESDRVGCGGCGRIKKKKK